MLRIGVILLAGALMAKAAAPERTEQRLRSLAVLPPSSLSLALGTSQITDPEKYLAKEELQRRIERLQREVSADPNQAEKQVELAVNLGAADQSDLAQQAWLKAEKLLRVQAQDRPADARVQVRFARALDATYREEEAEHVLRKATERSPESWVAWIGLAEFLARKGLASLFNSEDQANESLQKQIRSLLPQRPTPQRLETALRYENESAKCFDRAEAVAPKEPQVVLSRAVWTQLPSFFRELLLINTGRTNGQKAEFKTFAEKMTPSESRALWAKAARLNPTNFAAIGYWGWLEAMPGTGDSEPPLAALSGSRRDNVLEAMRMLEQLGEHPNAPLAAGALEALGILRFITSLQQPQSGAAFRRAVTLDPSRKQAWQGLISIALLKEDYNELVAVCEERLKHDDTPHNQIDAAKACLRAGSLEKALRHAKAAVKLDERDPGAQICLAALLIRQSQPGADLTAIQTRLTEALESMKKLDDKERVEGLTFASGMNFAIVMALQGELTGARRMLDEVAKLTFLSVEQKAQVKDLLTVIDN